METREIPVQRFSVTSAAPFNEVVRRLEEQIGHPDMSHFRQAVTAAQTYAELEAIVHAAVGPSDLMEFVRFNAGDVLGKTPAAKTSKSTRLVVGNPLIMRRMVEHAPDAASYAPVNILIDERSDGVRMSYDRMASLLAPYGSLEALQVAQDLDSKIEALLLAASL